MKQLFYKLILVSLIPFSIQAQLADRQTHVAKASQIVEQYNAKNFNTIYELTSVEYKRRMKPEEFVELCEGILFKQYGEFKSFSHFKDEKSYQTFIVQSNTEPLQMNLAINQQGEITILQFFPYQLPPGVKLHEVGTDNPMRTKLDSMVDRTLFDFIHSSQNCGISVGIINKGEHFFYNYGETKRASKKLPDSSSIFEIGSITNTFTGFLLAKAVFEKKLALDDDISKYLLGNYPNLSFGEQNVKIVHLVNHTAGLPGIPYDLRGQPGFDSLNPYKNYSKKMMLDYLHKIKLNQVPGSKYNYSSYGMALLGLILESVNNLNYEDLLNEKICKPFGMTTTGIQLTEQQNLHLVSGNNFNGKFVTAWDLGAFVSTGGIRSSTYDLITFLEKNISEQDSAFTLSHKLTFDDEDKTALAWFVDPKKFGDNLYWQSGATFGCTAFYGFMKNKKMALVILSNSSASIDHLAIPLFKFLSNSQ